MIFYSLKEILWMMLAAVAVDLVIGDPKWPTHPVIRIGSLISFLERKLRKEPASRKSAPECTGGGQAEAGAETGAETRAVAGAAEGVPLEAGAPLDTAGQAAALSPRSLKRRGIVLAAAVMLAAFAAMTAVTAIVAAIHPWLGYAVTTWFISTTIAVKGLKDAARLVAVPLAAGDLAAARKYTGYIVGRDTKNLDEGELTRAVVETVAENTVDGVVSPLVFALIGGAPLAMLYRAANTLDSMVGYKNDRYVHFGWASARWDDVMNWIPARLTGILLILAAAVQPRMSAFRAARSVGRFARLHPSPNSGIPESAVAGALGIELGGRNTYGTVVSERARMGWPLRPRNRGDIDGTVRLLYGATGWLAGGVLCAIWLLN
ncbi:cobalamin biosynthesis protein CobD [Paenibacillus chitinolyticus]|uniref:Cobalamin biosynthesis protein CobD n=1 Tax=Paenibacillus chitinolyticus TaxID=79263 RepID=A0A410WSM8_9BACL|nr:adenosylcobinamide-phosphate synthase CbiB [Paenibacillus chitinolyticus]MCY9588826.1 adenosylcobinamide-phosphate synthase CbiB [Paenibacillus chitinolyticus]MCY9595670.1 adenosylcobinamide-phosphate synthase CbiB [Paenibacillus chitinolyticus]QAV17429.1 cobalamin biosynthesis protein CobD [Paenibacillus chitinolyticus]